MTHLSASDSFTTMALYKSIYLLITYLLTYLLTYWCRCADAYSDRHIVYTWLEGPRNSVSIDQSVSVPQFELRGFRAKNKLETLSTGITGLYTSML